MSIYENILNNPTGVAYDAVLAVFDFFSSGSIILITVLIVILHQAGNLLIQNHTRSSVIAPIIAAVTLVAAFAHCYVTISDDHLSSLLEVLIRSMLACALSFVASLILCHLGSMLSSTYRKIISRLNMFILKYRLWREDRRRLREVRDQPEPTLLPPRSRRLRKWLKEAQKEFDLEAKLITETTSLDDDERNSLMLAAKQRYIQKVNGILQ